MRAGSGRTTATEIMICESFGMGKHLARGTSAKPFSPSACHTACVQNTMARGLLASSHSPRTHLDARAPTATPERSETQLRQDDATTEPRLSAYKADEDVDHTLRLHSRTNRYTTPTSLQLLMPLFTPTRMALQIQKHPIIKLPRGGWVAPAPPPGTTHCRGQSVTLEISFPQYSWGKFPKFTAPHRFAAAGWQANSCTQHASQYRGADRRFTSFNSHIAGLPCKLPSPGSSIELSHPQVTPDDFSRIRPGRAPALHAALAGILRSHTLQIT